MSRVPLPASLQQHTTTTPPENVSLPYRPIRLLWVGALCTIVLLMGCTHTKVSTTTALTPAPSSVHEPGIIKHPDPVIQILYKQGRALRYNIYNRSSQNFRGMVVIFEGIDCDGIRPRRLWAKVLSEELAMGQMKPYLHSLPNSCHHVKVSAFDQTKFTQRYKQHRPFVRYYFQPDQQRLFYRVYNNSILPFRGIAVLIRGQDCNGPKPNYLLESQSQDWLQPGYLRSFTRNMPYPCRAYRVVAFDLLDFQRIKQRMLQIYQRHKQNLPNQPQPTPQPTPQPQTPTPNYSPEI